MGEIPQSRNIGWDVVGNYCISTGMIPRCNPEMGWYEAFETIIWEWDATLEGDKRTNMVHMDHYSYEEVALKRHIEYIEEYRDKPLGYKPTFEE